MSVAAPAENRSLWPRVLLVLWVAWVLALAAMSWREWGASRRPERTVPAAKKD
jgi:hypothetical protein